jgi:hypothetical protein
MKRELRTILIAMITMASILFAMPDPPGLPGAPNQGPIGGMIWLAIGGGLIVLKKYIKK